MEDFPRSIMYFNRLWEIVGNVIPIKIMMIPTTCKDVSVSLNKRTDTVIATGSSIALKIDVIAVPTFGTAIENK